MRKILLALLAAALLSSPALAQKSKLQINNEIDTFFPDNTVGAITPGKLRAVTKDIVASYVDWLSCTGTGGLVYWSSGTPTCLPAGSSGQILTISGGMPAWAASPFTIVGGSGISVGLVGTTYTISCTTFTSIALGCVPASGGGTVNFLRADGSFSTVSLTTSVTGTLQAAQMPALTGDVSTPGASLTTTLATVNSNVGSFGTSTSIPTFTVNAKGLITAASGNAVVAPAGTLTGGTLAANVLASSLTSVGTLTGGATGAGFTVALGSSTITGTLPCSNLSVLTGDVTSSSCATTIANNTVTNAKSAQMAAVTLKGNPTSSTANASDFTINGLTQSVAPNTTNDMLVIWDSVANTLKKINPNTIASAAIAGVSSIAGNTGAFTLSGGITNSTNDIRLANMAANTVKANVTGSTAAPTDAALPSCSGAANALNYTSGTGFGCRSYVASIAGNTGAFTLGAGLTNSVNSLTVDKATAANYYAGTSNKVPTTDVIYPANVTITYGTTTSIDFSTFNNATITLTGNITTMNVSNVIAGKSGRIRFIQDATGSRTTVWNSTFKFAGGTTPSLSTAASAVDVLYYDCETSPATVCYASLNKDMK